MNIETLFNLYYKERQYQKKLFGEYSEIKSLNLASFLIFIDEYLKKAEKSYSGKWNDELPTWLENCKEFEYGQTAPIEAYEHLIKVFALAGAALETLSNINPEEWRKNPEKDIEQWKK